MDSKETVAWRCLKLDPDPRITLLFGTLTSDDTKTLLLDRFSTLARSEHEYWYALFSNQGFFGFLTRFSLHQLAAKQENDNFSRRLAQDEASSSSSASSKSSLSSLLSYSQRMLRGNYERIGKKMPEKELTNKNKNNNNKTATKTTFTLFQEFQQGALQWSSILVTQRDLSWKAPMVLFRPLLSASSAPTPSLIDPALLIMYELNGLTMDEEIKMLRDWHTVRIQDAPGAEDARGIMIRQMIGGKFDLCSCRLYANRDFTCYTFICDYPSFLAAVVTVSGVRILREGKIKAASTLQNSFWTFFCSAYLDQFRALREKRVVFSPTSLCPTCRDHWRISISPSSSLHFASIVCDPTNH